MNADLLQAEHLQKYFPLTHGLVFTRIKGYVQARRRITAIEPAVDRHGRPCCALVFAPELDEVQNHGRADKDLVLKAARAGVVTSIVE